MTDYSLQQLVLRLIAYVFIAAIHGFAVAAAAYLLGDHGVRHDGRLRVDPLAHLDLIGTVAGVLFSVGWIKPVAVEPKATGRAGLVLVVAAGIAATLLGAIALRLVRPLVMPLLSDTVSAAGFALVETIGSLSLWFALFNLLPVPPLTGAHLIAAIRPAWGDRARRWQFYSEVALVILAALGAFATVLSPAYRLLAPAVLGE